MPRREKRQGEGTRDIPGRLAVHGAICGGEPEVANPGHTRGWQGGGGGGEEESLHGWATLYAAIWTEVVRCWSCGWGGPKRGEDGGAAQDGMSDMALHCALCLL